MKIEMTNSFVNNRRKWEIEIAQAFERLKKVFDKEKPIILLALDLNPIISDRGRSSSQGESLCPPD